MFSCLDFTTPFLHNYYIIVSLYLQWHYYIIFNYFLLFIPYIIYRPFFLFLVHDLVFQHLKAPIFTFCSRIMNIIADIFISTPCFCLQIVNNYKIQNIQNAKFFADSELQNTKFIFYIDNFFFLKHLKTA